MQHFLNHTTLERAAAEVFSGPRARNYFLAAIAFGIAAAAGLALAAIWLGLTFLVEETRRALGAQSANLALRDKAIAALALSIADAAALAAAPALTWYARADLGAPLAIAMLCALAVHGALNSRHGRLATLAACAPYGALALLFTLEAAAVDAFWPAAMGVGLVAYVFAAVLHHAHRAAHARMLDAEWVRQLNMNYAEPDATAWEIDFARARVHGGDKLAALLGQPLTFESATHGLFAPAEERTLVQAMFAPGATRNIVIEHDVVRPDGARFRLRHQGFMRTHPDGAPARFTCVSRKAVQGAVTPLTETLEQAESTRDAQSRTLALIANELGTARECVPTPAPERTPATPDDVAARLAEAVAEIDQRRNNIAAGVDDLVRARNSAESANLAKSQFLANMSHELRTPLNAIIGYAEMLQEDAVDHGDKAAAQDLDRILVSARHLLGLVGEVLDLSKIEAGRMEVSAAPFEPGALLSELIETVRPLAVQNNTCIVLHDHAAGPPANTDATKVRQCVLNLLSNACKFTQGGRIDVLLDRHMHDGVAHFSITVSDTGIGMAPEFAARLFQPFLQADPGISQRYGGTGLGLAITRRLARLMGGEVSVESVLAVGSTFTLAIPADYPDARAALGATAEVDDVQGAGPLVVVIEDEADAREIAARALTRAGFSVQGVGGGESGLALARAKSPALVLLDIFLPDRSGWRVLQSLKQDPQTRDIPVVVLSINEDRAQALALGAAEHLVKPADRDLLAATAMRFARLPAAPRAALAAAPVKQAG